MVLQLALLTDLHIADQRKRKLISHIKSIDSRVSVTLDESTIHGLAYMMIIYVRCDVTGKGDMDNLFFQIVELDQGTGSEAIYNALLSSLKGAGMDSEFLQAVHCLAHRLELAVNDSLKIVTGCNHFEFFISKLYALYHQLTKNSRALKQAAMELNMMILKIGNVFTIRWVSIVSRLLKP